MIVIAAAAVSWMALIYAEFQERRRGSSPAAILVFAVSLTAFFLVVLAGA